MSSSPSLSFDIDSIREIAQLLRESDLGEICLETTGSDETTGNAPTRLRLKRAVAAPVMAAPAPVADLSTPVPPNAEDAGTGSAGPAPLEITSQVVGIFREAKVPVKVGDEIKVRQVLGSVESLRVPNDIITPTAGRVLEVSTQDGHGVEYGQTLFVIEEI